MLYRTRGQGQALAARGESLAAFDGPFDSLALSLSKGELAQDVRCIPAGCVAPRSHTAGVLGRRALPAGRLARLGATPDFHHGLLDGVLIAACVLSASSAAIAAPVLRSADLEITVTSPTSCEVAMALAVEDASEIEHRIEALEGSRIELAG